MDAQILFFFFSDIPWVLSKEESQMAIPCWVHTMGGVDNKTGHHLS